MPIGATRMMCPDPQMALEGAYLTAMEVIVNYEVTGNTMEISNTDGNLIMALQVDPFTLSEAFTREGLANISYLNEFAKAGLFNWSMAYTTNPLWQVWHRSGGDADQLCRFRRCYGRWWCWSLSLAGQAVSMT
jgi:hypothetical protein